MIETKRGTQRVEDREECFGNGKNKLTKVTCSKEENKNEIEKNL